MVLLLVSACQSSSADGGTPDSPPGPGGGLESNPYNFKADAPERVKMPIPVIPDWVDLNEVAGGFVKFRLRIDEAGQVVAAEVVEASHQELIDPALQAIQSSQYTITRDPQGQPVQVWFSDVIEF